MMLDKRLLSKIWISQNFSMKDIGDAMYILGNMISRYTSKRLIGQHQDNYIEKILKNSICEISKRHLYSSDIKFTFLRV